MHDCQLPTPLDPLRHRGFSLVELLAVIAVIALLMGLSGVAFNAIGSSSSLGAATQLLEAEIALAAQQAVSRNVPVELRFYTGLDPARFAAVSLANSAQPEFLGRSVSLPDSVVFETSADDFSTLLGSGASSGTEPNTAPGALRGATWRGFTIRPDGRTNLSTSAKPWTLTLKNRNARPSSGLPAANFVTLVVDPVTASVRIFQP